MPLLNDAADVLLGDTHAQAVYLGDAKVWPSAPAGPTLYRWVGDRDTEIAVGPGEAQGYNAVSNPFRSGSVVLHSDGPKSGAALDLASAQGRTITLTGLTSGGTYTTTVTAVDSVGPEQHSRITLASSAPLNRFTVGEDVEVRLE